MRSLAIRLLAVAGGMIALALVVGWLVLGFLFERHSERQLQAELERHGLSLISALSLDPAGKPVLAGQPFDPRFGRPASGLYWRISTNAGDLRSRSLWDGQLPQVETLPARGWGVYQGDGPYEPRVLSIAREVQLTPDGPSVRVEVAADRADLIAARSAFGRETSVFLLVLWGVMALAVWAQVKLGLAPLDRVRRELDRMRAEPTARLVPETHPLEVRPLTEAVNALAQARARDVQRAREKARDLAHALKTPLTALRLQAEELPDAQRQSLGQSLNLLQGAVEAELARGEALEHGKQTQGAAVVERLMAVLKRTPDGAELLWDNAVPQGLMLPMGEAALLEVLGAILENGARFARTTVRVTAQADGQRRSLTVADDGPGIAEDQMAEALRRGRRLDETHGQSGLGLAIALDRMQATDGDLILSRSDLGGLAVTLVWDA